MVKTSQFTTKCKRDRVIALKKRITGRFYAILGMNWRVTLDRQENDVSF